MTKSKFFRDVLRRSCAALGVVAALTAGARAQTVLQGNEMIQSLARAADAAPPNLTAAILRQAAIQHMKDFPGVPATWEPIPLRLSELAQINVQIQFALNSAIIRPESYATIGAIADALHHPILRGYKFVVTGNTDTTGNRQHNLDLSQQRADAVVEALATTFGVDPARLDAVGLGEEALQDTQNPTDPMNRRVQIINVGKYLPR